MALLKCPECTLQVNDKAISCPHCGFPMQESNNAKKRPRKPNKRRRLPNGFGSITELKNRNLRKPFYAGITTGKDPFGKPIMKPFGYFETYELAYEGLIEYNRNPYDLNIEISVAELYDKWTDFYFPTLTGENSVRTITSAWAYCASVYNMRAKDLRVRHIKGCMEEGYRIGSRGKEKDKVIMPAAGGKARIKSMFNLMLDYALEYEIVSINYARTFDISGDIIKERESQKRAHFPFSKQEMSMLWENVNHVRFADSVLIQAYMGWRPQELAILRLDEVHLKEGYIQGGMKTDAGKQRVVPIHSKIYDLVKQNYDFAVSLGSEYLLNDPTSTRGKISITYDKYAVRFKKVLGALEINSGHRPHDPRNTFVTMGKKSGVDEYSLKIMVGHKIEDIKKRLIPQGI